MSIKEHYKIIKSLKISEKKKKLLRLIVRYIKDTPKTLGLFCRIINVTKSITVYSNIEESLVISITWKGDEPVFDISYLDSRYFNIIYDLMFKIDCWMHLHQ